MKRRADQRYKRPSRAVTGLVLAATIVMVGPRAVAQGNATPVGEWPAAIEEPATAAQRVGVGDFDPAADLLEREAVSLLPEHALTAYGHAVMLRIALGQEAHAERALDAALALATRSSALHARAWDLVERADALCASTPPAQAARCGVFVRARTLRVADADSLLDVQIRARLMRARASEDPIEARRLAVEALALYLATHPSGTPGAEREVADPYRAFLIEEQRQAREERRIRQARGGRAVAFGVMTGASLDAPSPDGSRRSDASQLTVGTPLDRARLGAAEARLLVLEADARRFDERPPPPVTFRVPAERERWVRRVLQPWITRRLRGLNVLSTETRYIVNDAIGPIDAAGLAAMGEWLAAFAAALRDLAWVSEPLTTEEQRLRDLDVFVELQHPEWEPFEVRAREVFMRCHVLAVDDRAPTLIERCEAGLNALDRVRFPRADEIVPALRVAER